MNKHSITCVVVDDDTFSRETLEDFLNKIPEIKLLKSLNESMMAIKYIATLQPDLVFLDINMPEKNGISVLNEINELEIKSKVIFVTGHHEYLLDALKKNAFDYLIKPLRKQDLDETLSRFLLSCKQNNKLPDEKFAAHSEQKIIIQNAHGSLYLSPNKIAYIEADGCYTNLHLTDQKTEIISKNIGKVESVFPNDQFFKISRSYIINMAYLNKIDRLRKEVHLFYQEKCIKLKASRNMLYDLESIIHKG